MPAKISLQRKPSATLPKGCAHALVLLPAADRLPAAFRGADALRRILKRRGAAPASLATKPLAGDCDGVLTAWLMCDPAAAAFELHVAVRKAVQLLAAEEPASIALDAGAAPGAAQEALYVILANGEYQLGKPGAPRKALTEVFVSGAPGTLDVAAAGARAAGNLLCRDLTLRPANDLAPRAYRDEIRRLAKEMGWKHREFDFKALRKMGAGAFCAVAQGSPERDAAIVRLTYSPGAKTAPTIALVGKGICMDTGGHNLKSAKHMYGMHEDMNGSAVALGILLAAARARMPVRIDCWLAIAQNHIGPAAYKQGDVVRALDGTSIEIVHTDAEGRMVLADTLTLAARQQPQCILDFATLTGSMVVAVGSRMAGVFASRPELADAALQSGAASGERVTSFPFPQDYDEALDSNVADIKQCLLGGEGDAIYAARFLARFTAGLPWVHMDLSAYRCEGGLGAVAADVTGFGVGWGLEMLRRIPGGAAAP